MKEFFNGKQGFALTFWISFIGVSLISRGVSRLVSELSLSLEDTTYLNLLDKFALAYNLLLPAFCVVLLRAVVKAGFHLRRPGIWGWIGIALISFQCLLTGYYAFNYVFPSLATPTALLRMEVNQLNKSLPEDWGGETTLQSVKVSNGILIFQISADYPIDDAERDSLQQSLDVQTEIGAEFCIDYEGYFHGGLKEVRLFYKFENRYVTAPLMREDCLKFLEDS